LTLTEEKKKEEMAFGRARQKDFGQVNIFDLIHFAG
jgi:hypothetical protein